MRTILRFTFLLAILLTASTLIVRDSAEACGGLFCQNVPVDQQAERIIFTVNADDTISAYVQINYTGSAPEFSWVVPVPTVPEVDVAEIEMFDELSNMTAPVFLAPPMPDCIVLFEVAEDGDVMSSAASDVEVLASGTAGPYQYDVVDSPDPDALVQWLRDNSYRITDEMIPLVHVYNAEGMPFLAMKLQPEFGAQDIQPVKMTYESTKPMIPLRLTAVAANPNMAVLTWIFADAQAYPTNYAHPVIEQEDIRFFPLSANNNYQLLVNQTVDLYEGRAFVTEYAGPTAPLSDGIQDEELRRIMTAYPYVTRFIGFLSPEEMTVDPVFDFDGNLPNVSNVFDLRDADPEVVWGCPDAPFPRPEYDADVVPDSWQ